MKAKKGFAYVTNVKSGKLYLLSLSKIQKEPGQWKTYIEGMEDEIVKEVEDNSVGSELSYKELKQLLTAANVEFKGNASKEELTELFERTL